MSEMGFLHQYAHVLLTLMCRQVHVKDMCNTDTKANNGFLIKVRFECKNIIEQFMRLHEFVVWVDST